MKDGFNKYHNHIRTQYGTDRNSPERDGCADDELAGGDDELGSPQQSEEKQPEERAALRVKRHGLVGVVRLTARLIHGGKGAQR